MSSENLAARGRDESSQSDDSPVEPKLPSGWSGAPRDSLRDARPPGAARGCPRQTRYDDTLTLAQARERYFADNGFDARYEDRWVKLRFRGRTVPVIPNTRSRIAAVRIHDLHHVVTGYDTTWTGEGEISAFELAGGCGRYLAAWVLNFSVLAAGFAIAPRRVWRAFVRGRHTKTLYREGFATRRLEQSVGELRRELGLAGPAPIATSADAAWFGLFLLASMLYASGGVLSLAVLALGLWKPVNVHT